MIIKCWFYFKNPMYFYFRSLLIKWGILFYIPIRNVFRFFYSQSSFFFTYVNLSSASKTRRLIRRKRSRVSEMWRGVTVEFLSAGENYSCDCSFLDDCMDVISEHIDKLLLANFFFLPSFISITKKERETLNSCSLAPTCIAWYFRRRQKKENNSIKNNSAHVW